MAKNSVYKDKSSTEKPTKKENTLDYYISKTSPGINDVNWWSKSDKKSAESGNESKKHEFLKKNVKASLVIPPHTEKKRSIPNSMGYFETRFGTVEVGYKKYKKDSPLGFSLVPDSVKEAKNIPEKKLSDPSNYFGGSTQNRNKKFKASAVSFDYKPGDGEIKKLEDDRDGIANEEEKLLYQDKKEDDKIEKLKMARNESSDKKRIDKELANLRDIKEEKNEDNLAFLKEINNFINSMKKGKLKKIVDSDDAISRRKRIIELSSDPDLNDMNLEELKKLLEKIRKKFLKKREFQKLPDEFSKVSFKKITKEQAIDFIQTLMKKFSGDSAI